MSPTAYAFLATAGSLWALVWSLLAARHAPDKLWARVFGMIAGLSAFYFVAWGWLVLFPDTDRALWSEAVTPASIASLFVVWGAPGAITYFRAVQRRHTERLVKDGDRSWEK